MVTTDVKGKTQKSPWIWSSFPLVFPESWLKEKYFITPTQFRNGKVQCYTRRPFTQFLPRYLNKLGLRSWFQIFLGEPFWIHPSLNDSLLNLGSYESTNLTSTKWFLLIRFWKQKWINNNNIKISIMMLNLPIPSSFSLVS